MLLKYEIRFEQKKSMHDFVKRKQDNASEKVKKKCSLLVSIFLMLVVGPIFN
jgi:hypothetical protein